MKGEKEEAEDVVVDHSDFTKLETVSGNDRYNVRYFQVDISNCPGLFYVFVPNYHNRNEKSPTFEFHDKYMEITYSFVPRNAVDIIKLLSACKLIEEGYKMAVEAAVKKSSWMDSEDCIITVQFPFLVETRLQVESDSWFVFCFHEKKKKQIESVLTDIDF